MTKGTEAWFVNRWRPAAAWSYIAVCMFDFILFPIAWALLQAILHQTVTQWNPITLQGAGLYHAAMGAVCGVAAWSRGKEKIANIEKTSFINTSTNTTIAKQKSVLVDTDLEDADNINRRR